MANDDRAVHRRRVTILHIGEKSTHNASVSTQTCDVCSGSVGVVLNALLDLILPTTCAACGLPGIDLCDECDSTLVRPRLTACHRCGHPWSIQVATCPECLPQLDRVRHAVSFTGPARPLIHAFKDGGRRRIGRLLADLIVDVERAPPGVLVPVPSTKDRERERGFNPAAEIARHLGKRWGMPVELSLRRPGSHVEQRGASATARMLQVRGAFVVDRRTVWPPVTLVDDVLTTGATLNACALTLRRAGARRVGALVGARVDVNASRAT